MKIILSIICLFLIVGSFSFSTSNTIKLELQIGEYYNNHSKRIFRYSEKKWFLQNDKLMYNLTGKDYSDSLFLSKKQFEEIIQIIENKELKKNITITYKPPQKRKVTHTKVIKGKLDLHSETYYYDIKENIYTISKLQEYKNIRVLENYLDSLIKKE